MKKESGVVEKGKNRRGDAPGYRTSAATERVDGTFFNLIHQFIMRCRNTG